MLFTNKHNLSTEIFKALTCDRYLSDEESVDQKTDYSVTTIMNPVQQVILRKRYINTDAIVEDASDRLWSMIGSAIHSILSEQVDKGSITEKRIYLKVMGKTISGQCDHYKDGVISDYKFTKTWKIENNKFDDYELQLNCYAYLFTTMGYPVNDLRIVAFLRDWSKHQAIKDGYPKKDIVEIEIPLWDTKKQKEYIYDRVEQLIAYENTSDDCLPPCTPEEMWQTETVYAVMKEGGSRSKKNFSDKQEAVAFMEDQKDKNLLYIETRQGYRTRCEEYCNVKTLCHQYQQYKGESNG